MNSDIFRYVINSAIQQGLIPRLPDAYKFTIQNMNTITMPQQQVINRANYHTPQIIGLTGQAYVGKTTVAQTLAYAHKYQIVSFATPIKKMLLAIGVPEQSLFGSTGEKEKIIPRFGKSGRYLMQSLGTEWGRDLVNMNIWVNLAKEKILDYVDQGKYVVIDDCRFASELSMINSLSGCVYRVIGTIPSSVMGKHASEVGLDTYDFLPDIYNTDDQYSLYDKIYNGGRPNMHTSAYEAYITNCTRMLSAEPKGGK